MRQLLLDFTQAPAPTFENFVPGGNAELAHALESAVRGDPGERVIYVWGERGAGKTHLLKAFAGRGGKSLPPAANSATPGPNPRPDDIRVPPDAQVALQRLQRARFFLWWPPAPRRDVAIRRDLATRLATGLTYRAAAHR